MFCTDSTVLSLESILEDPNSTLFKEFATYLHQSYCIENLAFWLATQEYYEECNDKQRQQQLCETMISLYILPNSPQEINIPCEMRQSILDYYHGGNLHLHIFDDAAEAVLELMRVNSFLPWAAMNSSSSSSPTNWSFDNSDSSGTTTAKHHKSWTHNSRTRNKKKSVINSPSSTSLTGLTTSFSFTDKWNLIKLKQQTSRRSCSSLDYASSFDDDNNRLALSIDSTTLFSVPSATTITTTTTTATTTTTTTTTSGTRYRTMLKRVKKSLLGGSIDNSHHGDNDSSDEYSTPRSSFTADTSSWTSWRKSQR